MRVRLFVAMVLLVSLAAAGCARKPAPAEPPADSAAPAPAEGTVPAEPADGAAPAPAEPAPGQDQPPGTEAQGDAVRVRVPDPDAEVSGDTIHVEGQARAYEATVLAEVEDGHNVLARGIITATAAAPEWGDFAIDLKLEQLPTNRTLMLILYVESAADGARKELTHIPLRYTGPCADNRC